MFGGSHRPTCFSYIGLEEDNGESTGGVGGLVDYLLNHSSGTLLIGDIVYYNNSAFGTVTKSATLSNYTQVVAGVVVGGAQTNNEILQDDAMIGTLAANVSERVLVAYQGIVKVMSGAAITALVRVGPGTATAGRTEGNTTAGQIIGIALQAAAGAALPIRVKLRIAIS